MIHFAMFSVPARYSTPSKIINQHELVGTIRLGSHITRRSRPLPCTHTFGQKRPLANLPSVLYWIPRAMSLGAIEWGINDPCQQYFQ